MDYETHQKLWEMTYLVVLQDLNVKIRLKRTGPSKSKSPNQQPSVTQVEGKKWKKVTGSVKTTSSLEFTSLRQVQPSSGAQLRAL
jgi:hypothetical protein